MSASVAKMSAMSDHDVPVVDKTPTDGPNTVEEDEEDNHECGKCRQSFKSIEDFIKHKLDKDSCKPVPAKPTPGRKRKKEASSPSTAEKRKRTTTPKRKEPSINQENIVQEFKEYKCNECGKVFRREATLRRHLDIDHDTTWAEIEKEYVMDQDEDEDEPEKQGTEEDAENVPVSAGQGLTSDDQTISFTIAADGEGKTYHTVISGTENVQGKGEGDASDDVRPYSCNVCQRKFKEASVLKAHMLTHSDKRDYPCSHEGCAFAFKTKGSLKRHMRRHTGERPFKCHLCNRAFGESGALTRHLKSRTVCTAKSNSDFPRYGKRVQVSKTNMQVIRVSKGEAEEGEVTPVESPLEEAESTKQVLDDEIPVDTAVSIIENESEVLAQVDSAGNVQFETATSEPSNTPPVPEPGEIHIISGREEGEVEITTEMSEDQDEDEEDGEFVLNQCKVCKESFDHVDNLRTHLKGHLTDLPFRCGSCHFVTDRKEVLAGHMQEQHQAVLKEKSETGREIEVRPASLNSTALVKLSRDGSRAVKQLLEIGDDSDTKLQIWSDNKGYRNLSKCPVCGRCFRGNSYLKLHMRSHTGEKPHNCPHCTKSFTTRDTLSKHLTVHSEDRHYKCGECGKLFKRISHVKEHLKIHTNERPFCCSVCDKTFKTSNACKVHLRTHTNDLPWECKLCGRNFREKGSLERHERTHTGEKPYACENCGRKFAEHGTLNRHRKAKVPCYQQGGRGKNVSAEDASVSGSETVYPTVLAEFSSVVADTQQYILQGEGEPTVEAAQVALDGEEAQEYVVISEHGDSMQNIQNIEVVQSPEGTTQFVILDGNSITVSGTDSIVGNIGSIVSTSSVIPIPEDGSTVVTTEGQVEAMPIDGQPEVNVAAEMLGELVE